MPVREHCGPMDIGTLGVDARQIATLPARMVPQSLGPWRSEPLLSSAGSASAPIAVGPFAPGGFYWRVGPRVSRSSAPRPAC